MRVHMINRRKELGLTQQNVADMLGITRTAVSAWEIGRNEPSLPDIIKLKEILKVNDDNIFLDISETQRTEKTA